jgi:hypothetical protein
MANRTNTKVAKNNSEELVLSEHGSSSGVANIKSGKRFFLKIESDKKLETQKWKKLSKKLSKKFASRLI